MGQNVLLIITKTYGLQPSHRNSQTGDDMLKDMWASFLKGEIFDPNS